MQAKAYALYFSGRQCILSEGEDMDRGIRLPIGETDFREIRNEVTP